MAKRKLKKQDSLHLVKGLKRLARISKRDNKSCLELLKMMKSKKNQRLSRRFEYAAKLSLTIGSFAKTFSTN